MLLCGPDKTRDRLLIPFGSQYAHQLIASPFCQVKQLHPSTSSTSAIWNHYRTGVSTACNRENLGIQPRCCVGVALKKTCHTSTKVKRSKARLATKHPSFVLAGDKMSRHTHKDFHVVEKNQVHICIHVITSRNIHCCIITHPKVGPN